MPWGSCWTLLAPIAASNVARCERLCDSVESLKIFLEHGRRLEAFAGQAEYADLAHKTADWFAKAYLDGLDSFVQRHLSLGAYVRYMDDFVVCHADPARLEAARCQIIEWLREHRGLEVHGVTPLIKGADGVDFVGHIVRPGYALLRRRVVIAAHERIGHRQAPLRPVRADRRHARPWSRRAVAC